MLLAKVIGVFLALCVSSPGSVPASSLMSVSAVPLVAEVAQEAGGVSSQTAVAESADEQDEAEGSGSLLAKLSSWARWLGTALGALVAVLVIIRVLRRKPALKVDTIQIRGFDEKQSKGIELADTILSRLRTVATSSATTSVTIVTGPLSDIELPEEVKSVVPTNSLSALSPAAWLNALVALVDWLVPPRILMLEGEVHRVDGREVGATVRLLDSGAVVASEIFWATDFEYDRELISDTAVNQAYRLTEYIAIWLLFKVTARLRRGETILGTSSWLSYAQFRAACYAYAQLKLDAAQVLYGRALDNDPDFHGARVNLARVLLNRRTPWETKTADRASAVWHLQKAESQALSLPGFMSDPTTYMAKYLLVITSAEGKNSPSNPPAEAIALAHKLIALVDKAHWRSRWDWAGFGGPELRLYLDRNRPAYRCLLAGLLIQSGKVQEGEAILREEQDRSNPHTNHQYNLACGFSLILKHENPASNSDRANSLIDDALAHLERSFQLNELAVLMVQRIRQESDAEKPEPSLKTLIVRAGERLENIESRYVDSVSIPEAPAPKPPALAAFEQIGENNANALVGAGIESVEDFIAAARDDAALASVEGVVSAGISTLMLWARITELTRIIGIGPSQANLLYAAGVRSLDDLYREAASDLIDRLKAAAHQADVEPPKIAEVSAWIDDARRNTFSVLGAKP